MRVLRRIWGGFIGEFGGFGGGRGGRERGRGVNSSAMALLEVAGLGRGDLEGEKRAVCPEETGWV